MIFKPIVFFYTYSLRFGVLKVATTLQHTLMHTIPATFA